MCAGDGSSAAAGSRSAHSIQRGLLARWQLATGTTVIEPGATLVAFGTREALDRVAALAVFGFAMVLLMIWRPRGLVGHRAPTVFLEKNQAISSDLVKEGHG